MISREPLEENDNNYPFEKFSPDNHCFDPHVSRHIFSFFRADELSTLNLVCKGWAKFFNANTFYTNHELFRKAATYGQHFKLYHNKDYGFLLDFNASHFYCDGKLDQAIIKDLGFDGLNPYDLSETSAYLWSPDGLTFYSMENKFDRDFFRRPGEKEIGFLSQEGSFDNDTICYINFNRLKATLYKNNLSESGDTDNEMIFNRCSPRNASLVAEFILNKKIKVVPLFHKTTPLYLFNFNQDDIIFIGQRANQFVIKIRLNGFWHEAERSKVIFSGKYFYTASSPFNDNIIQFTIDQNTYLATISPRDLFQPEYNLRINGGPRINMTLVMEVVERLAALGLNDEPNINPRPTPLDLIESNRPSKRL